MVNNVHVWIDEVLSESPEFAPKGDRSKMKSKLRSIRHRPAALPMPGIEPGIELLELIHPYVRHCGDARRPAWKIGPRKLLDYLVVYIEEGIGQFEVDGTQYPAGPGDLFWIPPGTLHVMEGFTPSMSCPYAHVDLVYRPAISHWDFSIPGGMVDLADVESLMHPPVTHPLIAGLKGKIVSHTNVLVGELLHTICVEAMQGHRFATLRMSGLMLEILAIILRGTRQATDRRWSRLGLLEQTALWMARHYAEPILMADLAARCSLSPSHFREMFGQVFGCSPRTYLRRMRLRAARSLMISSGLSISEIADQVGFETVYSFSKAFRAVEGLSPSAFRRCGYSPIHVEGRSAPYAR